MVPSSVGVHQPFQSKNFFWQSLVNPLNKTGPTKTSVFCWWNDAEKGWTKKNTKNLTCQKSSLSSRRHLFSCSQQALQSRRLSLCQAVGQAAGGKIKHKLKGLRFLNHLGQIGTRTQERKIWANNKEWFGQKEPWQEAQPSFMKSEGAGSAYFSYGRRDLKWWHRTLEPPNLP